MRIGMIGLGGMGGNLARRLMRGGHQVVAWDHGSEATEAVAPNGAIAVASIEDMAGQLTEHRTFWVMLPACEPTEQTVTMLGVTAAPGDIIIDGGNTFYKDDIRRSKMLATRGIDYVDVGTSGGVWGLERGYVHVGPAGAGHFVKMVHNGIEYGLMQAYAEGFDILKGRSSDKLAEVWRRGSVISSWLLDLSAAALARDHTLEYYSGHVADSGEGRWTADAAMEEAVPACVLSAALFARYRSRVETTFGDKLLSAMRFGFGGHIEIPQ